MVCTRSRDEFTSCPNKLINNEALDRSHKVELSLQAQTTKISKTLDPVEDNEMNRIIFVCRTRARNFRLRSLSWYIALPTTSDPFVAFCCCTNWLFALNTIIECMSPPALLFKPIIWDACSLNSYHSIFRKSTTDSLAWCLKHHGNFIRQALTIKLRVRNIWDWDLTFLHVRPVWLLRGNEDDAKFLDWKIYIPYIHLFRSPFDNRHIHSTCRPLFQ